MKPGDRVLIAIAGRAKHSASGYVWRDFPAEIVAVRRVTAIVKRDGWNRQEVVPLKCIKPLATFAAPTR